MSRNSLMIANGLLLAAVVLLTVAIPVQAVGPAVPYNSFAPGGGTGAAYLRAYQMAYPSYGYNYAPRPSSSPNVGSYRSTVPDYTHNPSYSSGSQSVLGDEGSFADRFRSGDGNVGSTVPQQPLAGTARVLVRVPGGARLWFDGAATTTPGTERDFQTPPLPVGHRYSYEIKASWQEQGHTVTQTQQVTVAAGTTARVDFPLPAQNSANQAKEESR